MNPVLGVLGNIFGNNNNNSGVGNAQANSTKGGLNGLNGVLGLFNMLKGKSDPMQTLQTMAQSNPQIKQAFDIVQQNGGDMKTAFYKLAEQNGIDPNQVLNMLK